MSIFQLNVFGKSKIEVAIERIQSFEPADGYYVAFSGGKDSIVVKSLVEKSGVAADYHYNSTSVDPPELIYFIRQYHKDVEIHLPNKTMWQLIPERLMPPTRLVRYCCSELKETGGTGRTVITGVRWAESSRRKNSRGILEANFGDKKKTIILNGDNDEMRRMFETCQMKSKHVLNPIIDWTDQEVWEYIKCMNIPYCNLYDKGFNRLGCIGCPMSGKHMKEEFKKYPKIEQAYLRAFDRMLIERRRRGLKTDWESAEDVMKWWISA